MIYHEAKTTREALKILSDDCSLKPIAGGTDLIIQWRNGMDIKGFVDISKISQLHGIVDKKNWTTIGASTTHSDILKNELINTHLPALADACKNIGSLAIRNRGTVGGNLLNASPASDSAPALLVYDASLILENINDAREVKIDDFFIEYKKTHLCNNELLTKIMIPPVNNNDKAVFYKIGARKSVSIAKVNACFRIRVEERIIKLIRIAFGSVAPIPIRLKNIEDALLNQELTKDVINKAIHELNDTIKPIDDVRSTTNYRLHIAGFWLKEFLEANLL